MMSPHAGLCESCRHAEQLKHPRGGAGYWRCLLADSDPRFERYPRLPVLECDGYERVEKEKQD